jgi:hypothetical protein
MNSSAATAIAADLRAHSVLCEELLSLAERESQALRAPQFPGAFEFHQQRQHLLPRLNESLAALRKTRTHWQRLEPAARRQNPEVAAWIRATQDLIMKIIVLDRENEQARLRHGLLPANQLPAASRQRPHFVTELYRRTANT